MSKRIRVSSNPNLFDYFGIPLPRQPKPPKHAPPRYPFSGPLR